MLFSSFPIRVATQKMPCSFERNREAELSASFELSAKDAAFVWGCGEQVKRAPGDRGQESDGSRSLFAISICLGGVSMTLL